MTVAPYDKAKPIYYEFTACPAAEFAIRSGVTEIMPDLCNGFCIHGATSRKTGTDDCLCERL